MYSLGKGRRLHYYLLIAKFEIDAKQSKIVLALFAKEQTMTYTFIPEVRDVQHQIDLKPPSNLPNCPHYRMNPRDHDILQFARDWTNC